MVVSPRRRNDLAHPQQARPVNRPSSGLHDQSEGKKELKSIPLLLTTNFPLLKTALRDTLEVKRGVMV